MTENEAALWRRIVDYLYTHRDATALDIARGIEADYWTVQHAICHMNVDGVVRQTGRRESDGRPLLPVYALPFHI